MSLLIVGSTSKITQNIVLQLARLNLYKSITISDLLPTYHFHQRYYRLRRNLVDHKLQTQVTLSKITRTDDLYWEIQAHQDILYVTHDYFESVTSKTKLMELTAEFSKNVPPHRCRNKTSTSLLHSNMTISGLTIQLRTT
jgi:hypothetical protein